MEFERKYGVATTLFVPLIKTGSNDQALAADYTHVAGDTKISKDGGAAANIGTAPSAIAMGNGATWKITISATEMQAAQIVINISDSAAKAVEDQQIIIATYGNASAEHAFDRNTAIAALVDDIWDELLSGHNVGGSVGKALRQIVESNVSVESTVNDASATTTSFVTALTEATDDHFIDVSLVFIDGALAGQSRPILSYNGTTKVIVLEEALTEVPADGAGFIIKTDHVHPVSQIADGILDRDMSTGADSGSSTVRTVRQALRPNRNKVGMAGGVMTVYKEDDATASHTAAVTTAAGDPITEIDPAG